MRWLDPWYKESLRHPVLEIIKLKRFEPSNTSPGSCSNLLVLFVHQCLYSHSGHCISRNFPTPALPFPTLASLSLVVAHLFQTAPILEHCLGILIPDEFKLAAL